MNVRRATKAGSWYELDRCILDSQLQEWLDKSAASETKTSKKIKSIIAPHAGYSYSGPTAAYAYQSIDTSTAKVIFILGPSHHVHFTKPQITSADTLETPLGNLTVNTAIRDQLLHTGLFEVCNREVDEDEHSIEMQLPYLAKVIHTGTAIETETENKITVVPIMVGSLCDTAAVRCGEALVRYFDQPDVLFVISSDFCHWGKRFRYQPFEPYDSGCQQIHQYISHLDKQGMTLIEAKDREGFVSYLESTRNTICGRYPIILLLAIIEKSCLNIAIRFVHYTQSSAVTSKSDSSVSYASAVVEEV